eukprot:gnl/MRDRNA2_/MRDRNA2_132639_c0_seq1.p1 gnl/MRDRNA2_/MRDRNA2_132639_c0~~gnl/MRDRNA2_/MRDRNA2_132639_c0_seq1.p1  ORF type:complete len:488 (+),score=51.61 gnl/MRDRNA2_/MRDRNA2_132639_c0_seq1:72-1535(+)
MAQCGICTACSGGQLSCLPVRRFMTLLTACVVSAFLGAFASVYVVELHLQRSHSAVASKVKEVFGEQTEGRDIDIAFESSLPEQANRPRPNSFFPEDLAEEERESAHKRALGIFTVASTAGMGCFPVSTTGTIDVSGDSCNGNRCPDCFINTGAAAAITLTISACSSAKYIGTQTYSGVREYMFVNADTNTAMFVSDGTNTYKIPPVNMIKAACYSGGGNRLYFPSNFGVSQNAGATNVGICPDACDAVTPKRSSDTAAFSVVRHFTVAEKDQMTTAKIGYLTANGPTANVEWSWMFNPTSFCPKGCDAAAPASTNDGNPAFTDVKHIITAKSDYLTNNGPTANIDYTRLGRVLANDPVSNVVWSYIFNPASQCPAACDAVTPASTPSGNDFTTVKHLSKVLNQRLTGTGPPNVVQWNYIFDPANQCPRGCDTVTPVDTVGTAFANVGWLSATQKTYLVGGTPTLESNVKYYQGMCSDAQYVCVTAP